MRTWRNWQTRKIQVLMVERLCRFKSCCPHHSNGFLHPLLFCAQQDFNLHDDCVVLWPFPAGVRCKASPVVRTTDGRLAFSAKNMRLFLDLVFL